MKKRSVDIGPHCPCCNTGAGALEIWAEFMDEYNKKSGNTNNEIQTGLKEWAENIRFLDRLERKKKENECSQKQSQ